MIYFDNSATTKPLPEVLDSYQKVAAELFGNPSSVHSFGGQVERLMQQSRHQAAQLFGVESQEVIFTSGGTEGNNMAIKGIAFMHQSRGKHIITSKIEHPSVLEAFRALETLGFEVTYIDVNKEGKVDPESVEHALRTDTILVSIMSVNNELGSVQPVKEIGDKLKHYPKVFFHVDHVQGLGKIRMPIMESGIDLCTVSGHKIHGLKGSGALIIRKNVSLFPLLHGGDQELERRAGTENLPANVAFVKALRLIMEKQKHSSDHLSQIHQYMRVELEKMEQVVINSPNDSAPHIINFSIPGFKPEVVIHSLGEKEIYISTKSACSSREPEVSTVLKACSLDYERTSSALRVSLSYQNTIEEADSFIEALKETIEQLKETMRR
ncbi:cysteine desulfurase [Halobacillus halophilus]|uniref:Aminotransferase n=1 Tax=Halobacillus halophilus (strain ATCC 35676 / DSM 2266 / JCM 20832 / KCTC 3685 / LMG 17431 / NBRC 102448 / NCIMB 2269) TaxID=866895 RepID=I0JPR8_HALH3|nr:cysteine desulfurase family protein [Halobacillus halophilus]ASF40167.1 cysteine desulfurase [Halobacillus halophilus]CCG46138.1 aminotransferase [Halobacillus halophilus DSM 2266]